MFRDNDAFSSFSVDDIDAAKQFYGEKLGLAVAGNEMGNLDVTLGTGCRALIYPKSDHEPATFTVLNFLVADLDATVDALVAAGTSMERYDGPEMTQDERGIVRNEYGPPIAWFKDPAGNVIAVIEATR
jgi:predicted enzyme related to lactoylglutathione lyase